MRHSWLFLVFACAASAASAGFPPNGRFVVDETAGRVLQLDDAGATLAELGGAAGLASPSDLAFRATGTLLVASLGSDLVVELDDAGQVVASIGAGSGLTRPAGLAIGPRGRVLVTSEDQGLVYEFASDGTFLRTLGGGAAMSSPRGIAIGPSGELLVAAFDDDVVHRLDPSGELLGSLGGATSLDGPDKVAVGSDGNVYVTSSLTDAVVVIAPDGVEVASMGPADGVDDPRGVALGPDGRVRVADAAGGLFSFKPGGALDDAAPGAVAAVLTAVAHAPFRFETSVKGSVSGDAEVDVDELGELTLFPGAGRAMLRLADASALAVALGDERIVLHGYEAFKNDKSGERMFHGVELDDRASLAGGTSILLTVNGKKKKDGFKVKSAKGALQRSSPSSIVSLKVKVESALQ